MFSESYCQELKIELTALPGTGFKLIMCVSYESHSSSLLLIENFPTTSSIRHSVNVSFIQLFLLDATKH